MPAGLPVAFLIIAQATMSATQNAQAVYGPSAPAPKPASPSPTNERECANLPKEPKGNAIVVCAVKPEGYRLPSDIVEARRLKKEGQTARPHDPHETYADHSCATVGPMGCRGVPTIDLLAVAAVAANIAERLSKGEEIGSIFETTPSSSEYQLYLEAKRRREARDAHAAATAAKAKAQKEEADKRPSADLTASAPTNH